MTGLRRGRWGRQNGATEFVSDELADLPCDGDPGAPHDSTAAAAAPAGDSCAELPADAVHPQPADPETKRPSHAPRAVTNLVYTIGTWRVSREMYLWHLLQLKVRLVIDVRGNPRAGRQEDMHQGKPLTRALQGAGIRYEYWGDRLGEEQVEEKAEDGADLDLQRALKGMLAASLPGPLCLLGHMHEPHKCHRLRLSGLLPADWEVWHIMWQDHQSICLVSHADASRRCAEDADFFWARRHAEERQRREERARAAEEAAAAQGRSRGPRAWRGGASTEQRAELDSVAAAAAAAAAAAGLPRLVWAEASPAEWEDRLRDGQAYRILLPWDTELLWYPRFLDHSEASELEQSISSGVTMYHPTYQFQTPSGVVDHKINRKGQAKICDDFTFKVQYSSKGEKSKTYEVMQFDPWSRHLMKKVEAASESVFNAIWFNHYRDGTVTIQWHTDSDEGLGPNAIIGSLSLGSARVFGFKSKRPWQQQKAAGLHSQGIIHINFPLFHGSLLVMGHNSQTHWLHAVPAMEGVRSERTNLTFRFYAHKDLVVPAAGRSADEKCDASGSQALAADSEEAELDVGQGDSGKIQLRNSKLIREPPAETAEDDRRVDASGPSRLRLVPEPAAWLQVGTPVRPVLVDAPNSPDGLVGEFIQLLREAVMPECAQQFELAVPCADDGNGCGYRLLKDGERLLESLGVATGEIHELFYLPGAAARRQAAAASGGRSAARDAEGGPTDGTGPSCFTKEPAAPPFGGSQELQRELSSLPIATYARPGIGGGGGGGAALVPMQHDDADWVREVLSCLSGIQKKSKGKGQLSSFVFHQCSEFVTLYVGHPKSAVHLVVTPSRLLKRQDVTAEQVNLMRRLACYAHHLSGCLQASFPHLRFASGVRLRTGRVQQFHAHLLSLDFVPPRPGDLERRHLEDFATTSVAGAGATSRLLPLDALADVLQREGAVPSAPPDMAPLRAKALVCHRCGHLFGDAFAQLCQHLARCDAWPPPPGRCAADAKCVGGSALGKAVPKEDGDPLAEVEALQQREIGQLEEMGFGSCGRDALMAALVAEGTVERAVAVLAAC
mmetsp:Transcript_101223/g.325241  ORF Transcript_101223/g.325241 Transcript_101223/m.325241 type:complete len:1066 (+) Transcript_101223:60-3257(+)